MEAIELLGREGGTLEHTLLERIEEIGTTFPAAVRVYIDVPIGLPSPDAPVRACDRMARKVLGSSRASSVFPVPCREALKARTREAAQRINEARIGRGLSVFTWGICPKIAEVDTYLRSGPAVRPREIHPEVCFWALAGRRPMRHTKKTGAGREERLRVLEQYEPGVRPLLRRALAGTLRTQVLADDVIDAVAAFVTAEARHGAVEMLAGTPPADDAGLPIEIVYLRA